MRKRLDLTRPVEPEILERCIEIAMQAPSGSNLQQWHFVVVTDAVKKAAVAASYRKAFDQYRQMAALKMATSPPPADPEVARQARAVGDSAVYLAEHMHEVPVLVLACIEGRAEGSPVAMQASLYGSILPAAWSLMLALRARGLGSAWTTLHLMYEQEVASALGIPADVTQAVLLPVAWFTGTDFQPARRKPSRERTYWNEWGRVRESAP